MKATHESHAVEMKTLQSQLHQLQDVLNTSSMDNVQRLQEVG